MGPEPERTEGDPESRRAEERDTGGRDQQYSWRLPKIWKANLYRGDKVVVRADYLANTATLKIGASTEKIAVPDSRTIFDAVEERLGIERVDDVRDPEGEPDVYHARMFAEDQAAAFREKHPGKREPVHYLRQLIDQVDYYERCQKKLDGRPLTRAATNARQHVRDALRSFTFHDRWTAEGKHELQQAIRDLTASREAARGHKKSFENEDGAIQLWEKAPACIGISREERNVSPTEAVKNSAIARAVEKVRAEEAGEAARKDRGKGREIGD